MPISHGRDLLRNRILRTSGLAGHLAFSEAGLRKGIVGLHALF
jgi:hypothetical protein